MINLKPTSATPRVLMVPQDYPSIQSAVNAANTGDTILVSAGRYYENIVVNKPVSIIGDSATTTTVTGIVEEFQMEVSKGNVFYVNASSVTIANITVRRAAYDRAGIYVDAADNCVFTSNIVEECPHGVKAEQCVNVSITGNVISKIDSFGILLSQCSTGKVSGNKLENAEDALSGIRLDDTSGIDLSNNTITQFNEGIVLSRSRDNAVAENTLRSNVNSAIYVEKSPRNFFANNIVLAAWKGMSLSESPNCTLRKNVISGGNYNFGVFGYTAEDFTIDIDASNTVNGKPVYYLMNQANLVVNPSTFPNVGYLGIVNSRNVTVEGLSLRDNLCGLLLAHTTDSRVNRNSLINNQVGIYLIDGSDGNALSFNQVQMGDIGIRTYYSSVTTVIGNNITVGAQGIWMEQSKYNRIQGNWISSYESLHLVSTSDNVIYHNNFMRCRIHPGNWGGTNEWSINYPSGGNYWDDYSGKDVYMGVSQGLPGSDGIIDEAYFYYDLYPLAAPVQVFEAGSLDGSVLHVEVESNSTLTEIRIGINEISFNASGPAGTTGFCRVTVPNKLIHDVWRDNCTLILNGVLYKPHNLTDEQNTYFYISYPHPSSRITVIQEYPTFLALALALTVTSVAALAGKRLHRFENQR
jgi:parallel beta-helix repeat protein